MKKTPLLLLLALSSCGAGNLDPKLLWIITTYSYIDEPNTICRFKYTDGHFAIDGDGLIFIDSCHKHKIADTINKFCLNNK